MRRLDEIRKQNNFATLDDLEKAARSQGISFEDFKANIRNSIITGNVVRDEVGRTIPMSTAEQRKYYDEHKADFAQPEQVRLSEILVPTAANADDAAIAAAQKKAQALLSRRSRQADQQRRRAATWVSSSMARWRRYWSRRRLPCLWAATRSRPVRGRALSF